MILVTGGAGFIGSHFIRRWLSSTRENIVNLDAMKNSGAGKLIEAFDAESSYSFVKGDITNAELLDNIFATYRPRAVIHFAAESHVDKSIDSPRTFLDSNIMGTYELLHCATRYLKKSPYPDFRFVHISTDEVFGTLEPDEDSFTESSLYQPNSAYSASKAASDHIVRAWFHTYNLPTLTTHCSNNYGPWQYPEKLIPLVISKALAAESIPVYGDGLQIRDWLHVSDHCDAIIRVLEQGSLGETYNIGGNSEVTNITVVKTLCSILDQLKPASNGKSYSQQITFVEDRPGHDRRYSIDFSKIKNNLGWEPRVSFQNGMRETVAWYLDNQAWLKDNVQATDRQGLEA